MTLAEVFSRVHHSPEIAAKCPICRKERENREAFARATEAAMAMAARRETAAIVDRWQDFKRWAESNDPIAKEPTK